MEMEGLTEAEIGSEKSSGKTDDRILALLRNSPEMTIPELAVELQVTTRAVEKSIAKLRDEERLRRIGPAKGGRWEVVE
jgi:ATP-dependent DNA helicase RecG